MDIKINVVQKNKIVCLFKKLTSSVLCLLLTFPSFATTITPGETPTLPSSAYTLVETDTPTANSITLTQIDSDTGEIVGTKTYDISLNKTTYTYDSGANEDIVYPFSSMPITVQYDTPLDAINNSSDLSGDTISGLFLGGTNTRLKNTGKIGTVAADFIDNNVSGVLLSNSANNSSLSTGYEIGAITGDFIANKATSHIINNNYNEKIDEISSNFIGNNTTSTGHVIANLKGTIGTITGDFLGNTTKSSRLINNDQGTISSISGDFISNVMGGNAIINNAASSSSAAYIGSISGNFIANKATETNGAIIRNIGAANIAQIDNLSATFVNNTGTTYLIHNEKAQINTANITAVNNSMNQDLIRSRGTIGTLNATLVGNTVGQNIVNNYLGTLDNLSGLIAYNQASNIILHNTGGEIKSLNIDVIGNTSGNNVINNNSGGKMGDFTGNIVENTTSRTLFNNRNGGEVGDFTGDFIKNTSGEEILRNNSGNFGNIMGNFIENTSTNENLINNESGTMGDITGNFTNNKAEKDIISNISGTLGKLTADFTGNISYSGHLINNTNAVALGDIQGSFVSNTATDLIHYTGTSTALSITGDFSNNNASNALLYNEEGTFDVSGNFSNNTAAYLLYNTLGATTTFDNVTSTDNTGAILDLYNGAEDVSGNVVESELTLNNSTLNVNVQNGGVLNLNNSSVKGIMHSESAGVEYYGTTNIVGDIDFSDGTVSKNTVNMNSGNMIIGANTFNDGTVALNMASGTTLDIQEYIGQVDSLNFESGSKLMLQINGLTNYGMLEADTITVADGATLQAVFAYGIGNVGESHEIQLLKAASSTDFNNFTDLFDNNFYSFVKKDKNGWYIVTRIRSAGDVASDYGGTRTNIEAANAWIEGPAFSPANPVADTLEILAQTDGVTLLRELTALAPVDIPVLQEVASVQQDVLLDTASRHLRNDKNIYKDDVYARVWAEVYGRKAELSAQGKYYGFDDKHKGTIFGIDKVFEDTSSLGVGFQLDEADVKTHQRNMNFKTNTAFLYGEYDFGNVYMGGLISLGSSQIKENKQVLGTLYKENYNARFYGARALLGYEGSWFNPEAEVRYQHLVTQNYTDGLGQEVSKEKMDILTLRAGFRKTSESGLIRPEIYLGAGYDVLADHQDAIVTLSNGAAYRVYTQHLDKLSLEAGLGLGIHFSNHVSFTVNYLGQLRKHYRNHTGMVGLKYAFN